MIDHDASRSDQFIGTTAAIISAIGMGAAAGASVYGANKQADAASDAGKSQVEAARIAADAATHGADLQDAAAQRTEAFQREQADYAAQQQEVDRHANYGQYAANRHRIGSISQALGLGGVSVPGYVPGVVPHFVNASAPAGPSPTNFGAALAGGAPAAAVLARGPQPPGAPPIDPRLMAGNGGVVPPAGTPVLQPDGTYAMPSMPRPRTFGQYLGAA